MAVKRISVIGLGKLGLCLAAVFANRGFKVIGVDVNERVVDAVNRGESPIFEPQLARLIKSNRSSLSATTNHDMATMSTDATFVVVPTPSNKLGEFSVQFVKDAMRLVGAALAHKQGYHLVVLTSTVMPGSIDEVVRPTLEEESGKKCGKDFGLCYNPQFIALGDVVKGIQRPDFVLIGESDEVAGGLLAKVEGRLCTHPAAIERMSFQNAETAKIAVNSFITMKMSFANTLAEICERLPGGDVDRITRAIGRDKRIGPRYLKGAIGYGCPCFPRDNAAFARFGAKLGVDAELARATDSINKRQLQRIVGLVEKHCSSMSVRIGILGVAYKPNTNVTESSQSLDLARVLASKGYEVHVYDPAVGADMLSPSPNMRVEADLHACIANSDLCVIATPWKSFAKIAKSEFSQKVVLDCWRMLNGGKTRSPSLYIPLGRDMISRSVMPA